jgi:hypothetical protein
MFKCIKNLFKKTPKHEPKFFHRQRVKIIKGFYTGNVGVVHEFHPTSGTYDLWLNNYFRGFNADELELTND